MAVAAAGQLNLSPAAWGSSRSIDCFEKLKKIGEGTYGEVYKAKDLKTGEIVALKKIRMDNEREGFPITAIREIKILKKLYHHENIVKLKETVTSANGRDIYMVFEYMDHDLAGLADGRRFSVPQIKCYMKQLLTGLHYCHVNKVLHRDMKSANLLINNLGSLKLADFGLARSYSSSDHTNRVITLWYRPPELLLGATKYGPAVDMWSVGCIFAELLQGRPIFQGKVEGETLSKIFQVCGAPDENNWTGVSKLPLYNNFKPSRPVWRRVREIFRNLDPHALDLLDKMLSLDPSRRISAKDALDAEYFWTDPLPCDPKTLPKYESSHEMQAKKRRHFDDEEKAKRQKLQQHQEQQHNRIPPIQKAGQGHNQVRRGPPSQPMQCSQQPPPVPLGFGHHHMKPPSGGYIRPNPGQAGGCASGSYPPPPPYGSSKFRGGSGPGGHPNYSKAGRYGQQYGPKQ